MALKKNQMINRFNGRIYFLDNFSKLKDINNFLFQYKFKPYYYYRDIKERGLTRFFLNKLKSQKNIRFLIAFEDNNQPIALIGFSYLPWDSKIFKLKMGRILFVVTSKNVTVETLSTLIDSIIKLLKKEEFDFVDISANTMEVKLTACLGNADFKLMGTSTIYTIDVTNTTFPLTITKGIIFKEIEEVHVPCMLNLAEKAFIEYDANLNRFYADDRLTPQKVGNLYREWFSNCLTGEQADKIFVAEYNTRAVGFIACKIQKLSPINKTIGSVPLNALEKEFRHRGIYKSLVTMALNWFSKNNCNNAEIKTQITTLAPQYVWQKFGGRLVSSEYNFHNWLK